MKKWLIIVLAIAVMFGSQIMVLADSPGVTTPDIRLPTEYVTMNAKYGSDAWFDLTLSDVPDGFDISNGDYLGWCIQKNIYMTRGVNHVVMLYSSYDPDIPDEYKDDDWDKVNYVINHKIGEKDSLQKVVWYFIDLESYPSDSDAQLMIADADLNGEGFVPEIGEHIAILVEGVQTIQRTFLELVVPEPKSLGDFVWNDLNANGFQEKGEPGVSNVEVRLLDDTQTIIDITSTDSKGYFTFNYVDTGAYYIQFILPSGYRFSLKDTGSDDTLDSDVDTSSGLTDLFTVNAGVSDTSRDAGIYIVDGNGEPSPQTRRKHAPTADATAGEPYNGFSGEETTFDGSRSYDRDGYIINWSWDFGDGTKGYGEIVNHMYSYDAKYKVILTVIDNDNLYDIYETKANILIGNYPPSEPIFKGPIFGSINTKYSYTVVANDPDNDEIKYTINWGVDESTNSESEFLPSDVFFSSVFSWSEAGKYIITVKASDAKTDTDTELLVYIDALEVKNIGYITDDDSDGVFDLFHQGSTGLVTKLGLQSNDNYLIDYDGDGEFDYEYNSVTDELFDYILNKPGQYNIVIIIVAIIGLLSFLLVLIIFKRKKK